MALTIVNFSDGNFLIKNTGRFSNFCVNSNKNISGMELTEVKIYQRDNSNLIYKKYMKRIIPNLGSKAI
jgi:hypothetical protein